MMIVKRFRGHKNNPLEHLINACSVDSLTLLNWGMRNTNENTRYKLALIIYSIRQGGCVCLFICNIFTINVCRIVESKEFGCLVNCTASSISTSNFDECLFVDDSVDIFAKMHQIIKETLTAVVVQFGHHWLQVFDISSLGEIVIVDILQTRRTKKYKYSKHNLRAHSTKKNARNAPDPRPSNGLDVSCSPCPNVFAFPFRCCSTSPPSMALAFCH